MLRMFHAAGLALAMGVLVTGCGGKSESAAPPGGTAGSDSGSGGGGQTGGTSANGAGGTSANAGGGNASGAAGATASYDACATSWECVLAPAACCSACTPQSSDFVALNYASINAYLASRPCGDAVCPHCASTTDAWFGATCDAGHCKVFDARETELTECQKSSDCRLRARVACCEPCSISEFDVVSINVNADLASLVCGADTACDACAPVYPSWLSATCVSGRCQTTQPLR